MGQLLIRYAGSSGFPAAGFAVIPEQGFKFFKVVAIGAEMTEILTGLMCFGDLLRHLVTIESMKAVALNDYCLEMFSEEDVLNGRLHCTGASTRRSGNSNNGVTCGHQVFSQQQHLVHQAGAVRRNSTQYMRFGSSD